MGTLFGPSATFHDLWQNSLKISAIHTAYFSLSYLPTQNLNGSNAARLFHCG